MTDADKSTTHLFVYGLLMAGLRGHHHMTGSERIGAATLSANLVMLDLGDYPGLVPSRSLDPKAARPAPTSGPVDARLKATSIAPNQATSTPPQACRNTTPHTPDDQPPSTRATGDDHPTAAPASQSSFSHAADPNQIKGELYRIPVALLDTLDAFEGVPRLYQRQQLPAKVAGIRRPIKAWVYIYAGDPIAHPRVVHPADWRHYEASRNYRK